MYGNIEEAKCYEACGEKGWRRLCRIADTSKPLPSYSAAASKALGMAEEELLVRWRAVDEAFRAAEGSFSVLGRESPLFPQNEVSQFLYYKGDVSLLGYPRVTVIGSLAPSVKAKSDALVMVQELVLKGAALMAPLDKGLSSFALSAALKLGGRAIGVSSTAAGAPLRESVSELQAGLEEKGLVVSLFAPGHETPPWAVKERNAFIASASECVFLPEERDGGPSWAIADAALEGGKRLMLSKSASENPGFTFMKDRAGKGAMLFSSARDARKLIPRHSVADSSPDLFS